MIIWICDGEKSDIDELKRLIGCYKKQKEIGNVEVKVFGDAADLIQEMIEGNAADIIIVDAMIAEKWNGGSSEKNTNQEFRFKSHSAYFGNETCT